MYYEVVKRVPGAVTGGIAARAEQQRRRPTLNILCATFACDGARRGYFDLWPLVQTRGEAWRALNEVRYQSLEGEQRGSFLLLAGLPSTLAAADTNILIETPQSALDPTWSLLGLPALLSPQAIGKATI